MILFTILAIMAVVIACIAVTIIGTIGGGLLVLFGDLFVFAAILWLIFKIFRRKR